MRLCLSCWFVSPAGSLLCGRCGRSFGGRLCPRHHLSPAGSQFCVQCGKKELTDSTLFFPLSGISRLLAWGMVLLLISLAFHHAGGLLHGLWVVMCWALVHLLNLCPCVMVREAVTVLIWFLALLLLSWLLPEKTGARLRGMLFGILHEAGRVAAVVAGGLGRWLYRLVEGTALAEEKTKKKKQKH